MIAAERKIRTNLSYSGFPLRTTYHIKFQLKNNFFRLAPIIVSIRGTWIRVCDYD